jgi:hypothetical protein
MPPGDAAPLCAGQPHPVPPAGLPSLPLLHCWLRYVSHPHKHDAAQRSQPPCLTWTALTLWQLFALPLLTASTVRPALPPPSMPPLAGLALQEWPSGLTLHAIPSCVPYRAESMTQLWLRRLLFEEQTERTCCRLAKRCQSRAQPATRRVCTAPPNRISKGRRRYAYDLRLSNRNKVYLNVSPMRCVLGCAHRASQRGPPATLPHSLPPSLTIGLA